MNKKPLTDAELAILIRYHVKAIEESAPGSQAIRDAVEALTGAGIKANMNMGAEAKKSRRKMMEWYAGQLLDIIEGESWFAMNSILGCVDKFTAEEMPT